MVQEKVIWYSIGNGGDGSAYPSYFESEKLAELDQDFMYEGWGEPCIGSIRVVGTGEFDFDEYVSTVHSLIISMENKKEKYPTLFSKLDQQKLDALYELRNTGDYTPPY